jgi:hypothetical protein
MGKERLMERGRAHGIAETMPCQHQGKALNQRVKEAIMDGEVTETVLPR